MKQNKKTAVIALGGNALLRQGQIGTTQEQYENARITCSYLVSLIKKNWNVVITHGNGPQVGNIILKNEISKNELPPEPIDVCVAYSQGSIGYILQQALLNELKKLQINRSVVTMITQVLVDKNDEAFKNPTKPIGSKFYDKITAEQISKEKNWSFIEDSGRGYRRVVPSPKPIKVIQRYIIKKTVESGYIVITLGGGGVPVVENKDGFLEGIEAVIDKDFASSCLAIEINADFFLILTTVPCVYINFRKDNQKPINKITVSQVKKYLYENQFGIGSMQPKIEASIRFVETTNNEALICSIDNIQDAISGNSGTLILPDNYSKITDQIRLFD